MAPLKISIKKFEKFLNEWHFSGTVKMHINKNVIKILPSSGSFEIEVIWLKGVIHDREELKTIAKETLKQLGWDFLRVAEGGYLKGMHLLEGLSCDIILKTIYKTTKHKDEHEEQKFDIGLRLNDSEIVSVYGISRSNNYHAEHYKNKIKKFEKVFIANAKTFQILKLLNKSVGSRGSMHVERNNEVTVATLTM